MRNSPSSAACSHVCASRLTRSRTVAKEMKPRYAQGCDLFYHRMPVMGPHSWGGAAKTHLAYITQTAAKQYEEATE